MSDTEHGSTSEKGNELAIYLKAQSSSCCFDGKSADEIVALINPMIEAFTGDDLSDPKTLINPMISYGGPSLIHALTDLRDQDLIILSLSTIIENTTLEKMLALAADPRVSEQSRDRLSDFLIRLGCSTSLAADNQPRAGMEHHSMYSGFYRSILKMIQDKGSFAWKK